VTLHFRPTSGSWLNPVEAFSIITGRRYAAATPNRRRPHRAIERFIAAWNDRCRPSA